MENVKRTIQKVDPKSIKIRPQEAIENVTEKMSPPEQKVQKSSAGVQKRSADLGGQLGANLGLRCARNYFESV